MNITEAKYVNYVGTDTRAAIIAQIDGEPHSVPLDELNRHYIEIMRQVEAGTLTIADAE